MSGYLSRLATQTGLTIGSPLHSLATITRDFPLAPGATAADVVEQTVQLESKSTFGPFASAITASEPPQHSATGNSPAEHAEASLRSAPANFASRDDHALAFRGAGAAVSPLRTQIQDPDPSLKEQPNRAFENPAQSNIGNPAAATAATRPSSTRAAHETVQGVLAWIADNDALTVPIDSAEQNPSASSLVPLQPIAARAPAETIDLPVSDKIAHSQSAPALSSTPKFEGTESSVRIGSIHLTIEAPPEKPESRPAGSRHSLLPPAPYPPPAPGTVGSRLRRHYLRPY
jgi:hypothetical protein